MKVLEQTLINAASCGYTIHREKGEALLKYTL